MPELYQWQKDALENWKRSNYIGVVEAVTGAGKTLVAHHALVEHLEKNFDVLIIVPSAELQKQWFRDIRRLKDSCENLIRNNYPIELLGGGNHDPGARIWRIKIAVVNSAINRRFTPRNKERALLIADECHHYGAPAFQRALKQEYARRLGLTATYEREDDGIETYLSPYFKGVCFSLDYKRALAEDVIAKFKIAFVGIDLDANEREMYDDFADKCGYYKNKLLRAQPKLKEYSFGNFMREASRLSRTGDYLGIAARSYLSNFTGKRSLLANSDNKYKCLSGLTEIIRQAERTIIFSQTKKSAGRAIGLLRDNNLNADVLNSDMSDWQRQEILADFESGETEVVAAPILLDEGINVPSADLAIILASSKTKRQMIQRMGRVLRKKPNNEIAKIIVMYAKNTSEDTKLGAHEDFMEEIKDAAMGVKTFESSDINNITDYLK